MSNTATNDLTQVDRLRGKNSRKLLYGLKCIRLVRRLIGPVSLDTREPKGEPAHIPRTDLNRVEGNLGYDLGLEIHGILVTSDLDLQELLRLPRQHLVRQTLKRLTEHCEAAVLCISCPQMQITEPALPSPIAP